MYRDDDDELLLLLVEVVRRCLSVFLAGASTFSWSNGGASELVFIGFAWSDAVELDGKTDESPVLVPPVCETVFVLPDIGAPFKTIFSHKKMRKDWVHTWPGVVELFWLACARAINVGTYRGNCSIPRVR